MDEINNINEYSFEDMLSEHEKIVAQLENGDVCMVASDTVKKLPQAVDTARNG